MIEFHYLMKGREKQTYRMAREQFAVEALEIGEFMERMSITDYTCEVVTFGVLKFHFKNDTSAVAFKMAYHDNLISAEDAAAYTGRNRTI